MLFFKPYGHRQIAGCALGPTARRFESCRPGLATINLFILPRRVVVTVATDHNHNAFPKLSYAGLGAFSKLSDAPHRELGRVKYRMEVLIKAVQRRTNI